jgi:cell division protein FtsW (lipid II flippase)
MSTLSAHPARSAVAFVPRKRRMAELMLLVMALAIGISAYALVGVGIHDKVPTDLVGYASFFVGFAVACHIVVRRFAPYADPILLPVAIALNGIGLAMIHRIDIARVAASRGAESYAPAQYLWTAVSIVAFVITLIVLRDHRQLQRMTYTIGLAGVLLLLLPLVPGLGVNINGSRIWVRAAGYSFQPGEVAKICLAVSFAGYLVLKRDALALAGRRFIGIDLPRGRDLGPILLIWLMSLGVLVFEDDLGSSLLFFGLFVVLLYVATERPSWLVVGLLLFAVGAYVGYLSFGHVQARVEGWLHPESNPDAFYQILQARYGLGWGGILGQGWGRGSPQLTPYSWSDFIATSLGEELGLTGLMALVVLYALMVERGIRTALVCRDSFGKLLSVGLSVAMALQVFVVIGGVTKLIPLTGLTTPFLSYGGSSLLANWVIIAILMRISDRARQPPPEITAPTPDDATQVVTMR